MCYKVNLCQYNILCDYIILFMNKRESSEFYF